MTNSPATLKQKLSGIMDRIEAMPPLKRRFVLASLGAASIVPGALSFKLVSLAAVLAGASGMLASEIDRKEDGGNKNVASVLAGAFLMGVTLAPFADVPDANTHMIPADKPQIQRQAPSPETAKSPAQVSAPPQVVLH